MVSNKDVVDNHNKQVGGGTGQSQSLKAKHGKKKERFQLKVLP